MANGKDNYRFQGFASPTTTPVPDQLFDELLYHLSPTEIVVLLYIIRRTYGFKKDSDNISLNQMVNGITTKEGRVLDRGTGLSKATVARSLNTLEEKGVIERIRRRSTNRGDEPTTYRVRELDPLSQNETPRVSPTRQAVSHQRDTQETVLQETERQDINPSNVRKASTSEIAQEERNETIAIKEQSHDLPLSADRGPTDNPSHTAGSTTAGFSSVGDVLTHRNGSVRSSRPQKAYSEERQQILSYIEDFARELGDEAPLASSVTRAYNLWQSSGIPIEAFCTLLYETRSRTWSVTANIKKTKQSVEGEKSPWGPSKNRMAYFFSLLEERVAKHSPAASVHPHPAPEAALSTVDTERQAPVDLNPKDDRETIRGYIERYAKLFGDEAPARSSVSRAYNLYERSGVSMARFIAYLFEAQSLTQEYSANVTKRQGKSGPFGPEKNRMAYFFSILQSKLQLSEEPPHASV